MVVTGAGRADTGLAGTTEADRSLAGAEAAATGFSGTTTLKEAFAPTIAFVAAVEIAFELEGVAEAYTGFSVAGAASTYFL